MNRTTACLSQSEIELFLSGETGADALRELEQHLTDCAVCRAAIENAIGEQPLWEEVENLLRAESTLAEGDRTEVDFPRTAPWRELLGPTDDPQMLGRIGPYEIIGLLGQGGMGVVFKAFEPALNRLVAIKMLLPHLASSGAARQRFAREAQAAAAVVNDHVSPIYCVDQWQGIPYLVTQYTRGASLQKRLQEEGPLQLKEILRIGLQTARGLAAAHAQGLVHRDVKPSNILLDGTVERAVLTDFGLARAVDDATLTRTGVVAGTPQYMSPEQAQGGAVDQRSDLFSLGSVLYAMSTGHPPFRAETSLAVLRLISDQPPRSLRESNPELPAWFETIVMRLMAKRPEDRYESAAEVADLLQQCLKHLQQPTTTELPAALQPQNVSLLRRFGKGALVMVGILFLLVSAAVIGSGSPPPLAKAWTGDDWGHVQLNQQKPGVYEGTYFDHERDAKGTFTLKWSALEGRYNGSWHEATANGSLSLRLVDGEIRGALKTRLATETNPARPRLGDFTWKPRTEPNAEAAADVAEAAFTALLEERLDDFQQLVAEKCMPELRDLKVPRQAANALSDIPSRRPKVICEGVGYLGYPPQAWATFDAMPVPEKYIYNFGTPAHFFVAMTLEDNQWKVQAIDLLTDKKANARWEKTKFTLTKTGDPFDIYQPDPAADEPTLTARQVARLAYTALAERRFDDFLKYVTEDNKPGPGDTTKLEQLARAIASSTSHDPNVLSEGDEALAVFPRMPTPDLYRDKVGSDEGYFLMELVREQGNWRISSLDFSTPKFQEQQAMLDRVREAVSQAPHRTQIRNALPVPTADLDASSEAKPTLTARQVASQAHTALAERRFDDFKALLLRDQSTLMFRDEVLEKVADSLATAESHDPGVISVGPEALAVFPQNTIPEKYREQLDASEAHFVMELYRQDNQWRVRFMDYLSAEERARRWNAMLDKMQQSVSPRDSRIETSTSQPAPEVHVVPAEDRRVALSSEAEKAVASLVLVFYQDRARRAIPTLLVDTEDGTLAVTTAPTGIVPDGLPLAIDRIFVEQEGKPKVMMFPLEVSDKELMVWHTEQHLTTFQLEEVAQLDVVKPLSAVLPDTTLWLQPDAARVMMLDVEADWNLKRHKFVHHYHGMLALDETLPEGTPLFQDGKLAGVVLLGTRFHPEGALVVPAKRIQAMVAAAKKHLREKREQAETPSK